MIRGKAGRKPKTPPTKNTPASPIQRRLKDEQLAELVDAYQAGSSVRDLATRFGISRDTVYEHLKSRKIPLRQRGLSPEQIEEAAKLYEAGWSWARLGERYSVASNTVGSALRKAGVAIRPKRGG